MERLTEYTLQSEEIRMELATPITIYWDLPLDIQDTSVLQRTCSEIANCSPLMLQIYSKSVQPEAGLAFVLEQLHGSQIAISITIPVNTLQSLSNQFINGVAAKELLLYSESLADLTEWVKAGKAVVPQTTLGIAFSATQANWRELPEVVRCCRNNGINRLILPMQRLYNNETPFFISNLEQQELADALTQSGGVSGLNLTIHDPFLWRAFNPAIPFPQAGCQAANTMIAIAPDGGVYPCPTLPVRLGSLCESRLKQIISSTLKKQFRRSLLQPPAACQECGEIEVCRGGCRGRGFSLQGSLDALDIACK